ncbi:MAG TPA: hypothetical protein VMU22_08470 [Rhizomicrobium sp.]|nr:hypothetical protein [Rhizomicrobium sp.]
MRSISMTALLLGALLPSILSAAPMTHWKLAQNGQQQCEPWQVRDDNGNCVDGPNTFRPGPGYVPGAGEMCWAECECYNGAEPAADNCAPCSYLGQVCTRN